MNRKHRIAVAAFFFLTGLCFASWASRIPDISQRLHLNSAQLGGVLFALPVGLLASLPLAGFLVAKYGSRIVVVSAGIFYPLLLPMIGLVTETWQLVSLLLLYGLGGNLLNISMNTQAVGVEALYKRSIMASFHGVWSMAGFTGAAIGTFMIGKSIIPVYHFLIITALSLLIVLIASRFILPKDPPRTESQPIFAVPDRSLLNLGIIAFCCMICEGAMFDWSGIYFQKVVKAEKGYFAAGYTAFMMTMATGRFVGDWLVTKFGVKRILQLSGIVIASGLTIAVAFPHFYSAIAGFLLVGAGVSSVVPLVYSNAGKSKKMSSGVALAAVSTIGYLGFLFGPPMIGFIAEATSLRVSFILIAILGLTTTVFSTIMKVEK